MVRGWTRANAATQVIFRPAADSWAACSTLSRPQAADIASSAAILVKSSFFIYSPVWLLWLPYAEYFKNFVPCIFDTDCDRGAFFIGFVEHCLSFLGTTFLYIHKCHKYFPIISFELQHYEVSVRCLCCQKQRSDTG